MEDFKKHQEKPKSRNLHQKTRRQNMDSGKNKEKIKTNCLIPLHDGVQFMPILLPWETLQTLQLGD